MFTLNASFLWLSDHSEKLTVRPLQAGDEAALRSFHESLSPASRALFTPHRYATETIRKLIRRRENGQDAIFVALNAARAIVAYFFLWYVDRPVALLGIGLADAYQGKGLGRQLMEQLVEEGKKHGLAGIELTTCLGNERAFVLYRKIGFRYIGDVENVDGTGQILIERAMFMPLKEGARPMTEPHAPPV